jgi:four helix bundle protein
LRFQNAEFRIRAGSGEMQAQDLRERTRKFALRIIRLAQSLPRERAADVIGRQILRSGTSVGANYRAACRAKSAADFIAKLQIALEEADESLYWMELLTESHLIQESQLEGLIKEADEIVAILVASINTARKKTKDRSVRGA